MSIDIIRGAFGDSQKLPIFDLKIAKKALPPVALTVEQAVASAAPPPPTSSELISMFKSTITKQSELLALNSAEIGDISIRQSLTDEFVRQRAECDDALRNFSTAAFHLGNRSVANKIVTAGSALLQISNCASQLAPSAGFMGGFTAAMSHPVVGIAVGIMSLCSIFDNDDTSGNDQFVELMCMLSQQINVLHEDMIKGFNTVLEVVGRQHRQTIYHFGRLHLENARIMSSVRLFYLRMKNRQDVLQGSLNAFYQAQVGNNTALLKNLKELRLEKLVALFEEIESYCEYEEALSCNKYRKYLTKLKAKLVAYGTAPVLTGGIIDPTSNDQLTTALRIDIVLKSLIDHPAFNNLSLLAKRFFGEDLEVCNPIIWNICVRAFCNLVKNQLTHTDEASYPKTVEEITGDMKILNAFKIQGEKIAAFLGKLQTIEPEIFLARYQQALLGFNESVLSFIRSHENELNEDLKRGKVEEAKEELLGLQEPFLGLNFTFHHPNIHRALNSRLNAPNEFGIDWLHGSSFHDRVLSTPFDHVWGVYKNLSKPQNPYVSYKGERKNIIAGAPTRRNDLF